MVKPELLDKLQQIVEPVVISKGLVIWGIDLVQGSRPIVRIYVDTPKSTNIDSNLSQDILDSIDDGTNLKNISASIDQCAEISRIVGLAMEVEDVFSSAYILEVSTPGFSRTFFCLNQMDTYLGDIIEVTLNDFLVSCPTSLQGRKKIKGELLAVNLDENTFDIGISNGQHPITLTLNWNIVRKASREHIFTMPEKPGKKRKNNN